MYPINIVKQVKKLILPVIVYFITQVLRTLAKYEECDYIINNILQYNNLLLIYQKYN